MKNIITTGSRRIVANVWSDAAREASAQARRFENASDALTHKAASDYHLARADVWKKKGRTDLAQAHKTASDAHKSAVNEGDTVKSVRLYAQLKSQLANHMERVMG